MKLNTIQPAEGSKHANAALVVVSVLDWKDRWARSKGRKSRAGFHKVGFEGGQMPLQRRLPKRGFVSQRRA